MPLIVGARGQEARWKGGSGATQPGMRRTRSEQNWRGRGGERADNQWSTIDSIPIKANQISDGRAQEGVCSADGSSPSLEHQQRRRTNDSAANEASSWRRGDEQVTRTSRNAVTRRSRYGLYAQGWRPGNNEGVCL